MKLRAIAIATMTLASVAVVAQSVPTQRTLRWTPALSYESGGFFDESQIQHYTVYCNGTFRLDIPNDYTRGYTVSTDILGAGDHTCGVSETVDGIESLLSNTVDFPLGHRTPRPPTVTVE